MDKVLPFVGAKGFWEVLPPWTEHIKADRYYTCKSVRSIEAMLTLGDDPLNNVYRAYGLTEADYTKDLESNVYILTLQGDDDTWVLIPTSYVVNYPFNTGVPYQGKALAVPIGVLPIDKDLTILNTEIQQLIKDHLGIDTYPNIVDTSAISYIPESEHRRLEELRSQYVKVKKTYRLLYKEALRDLEKAYFKIQQLECFIKEHCCKPTYEPVDCGCRTKPSCCTDPLDIIIDKCFKPNNEEDCNNASVIGYYLTGYCQNRKVNSVTYTMDIDIIGYLCQCKPMEGHYSLEYYLSCTETRKIKEITKPDILFEAILEGCDNIIKHPLQYYAADLICDESEDNSRPNAYYGNMVLDVYGGCYQASKRTNPISYYLTDNINLP